MVEIERDAQRLSSAVRALLGTAGTRAEPRRVGGGIGHTSYLVALRNACYVLRLKHPTSGATLGLEEEYALLAAAARAGIAPEVLSVDRAHGAILMRFVPGAATWNPAMARSAANVPRIADLLKRLHGLAVDLRAFDAVEHAERYFAAAARVEPLSEREQHLARELRALAGDHETVLHGNAVCHNDLVAANVLDTGDLMLVDFEYAARASPLLDLASLAAMNDYGETEQRTLLEAYFDGRSANADEFAKVVRIVRLIAYFWARALPRDLRDPNARYLQIDDGVAPK